MAASTEKYDVVIVGAGLGGLECGAILSKEGKKVCVIEKNEQIGGNLQTFSRDGVTFDTGVHYIGGLDKGQNLYQFFNYIGLMERLELEKMDENGFDIIVFEGDDVEYPYGMGYENFKRILIKKFPSEEDAINRYCEEIQRVCDNFPLYNLKPVAPYADDDLVTRSAKEFIESITENKKLQNVLAGNNMLYIGIGAKTPLYVHALVVNSYILSSYRCAKGGDQVAKLLAKTIISGGGTILRKTKVEKINVAEGLANYIMLEDGRKIYGDIFISNIDPVLTLEMTETDLIRPAFRSRINSLENSVSAFLIYIVLKPGVLKYNKHNYYGFTTDNVWDTDKHNNQTWPLAYAVFEGVPEHQKEYCETLTIMSYMHYDEVAQWANTFNTTLDEKSRGEDYEAFKKEKAEKLLEAVQVKFPQIRNQIQTYYTATPLSYRDYIGTVDGNIYGTVKDFNNPMKNTISPKTKVPNLYFTGANVNLHGVLGVTVSAVLTCSMILGQDYLMNKIQKANETGS